MPGSRLDSSSMDATGGDVIACYRLLLGRDPDEEGLAHYKARVATSGLSVAQLVDEFLGSVEFRRAHPDLGRAENNPSELVRTSEGFMALVDATDPAIGYTIARTRTYEPDVTSELRKVLGPGMTFVDAGANMGWFSLLAASLVGARGRVVAVEPNPHNVALLRSSAQTNAFDNIAVYPVALADRPTTVALETDGSNGRVIPLDGSAQLPCAVNFVVEALPLDDVLASAGVERVDVLKIDIEGAEPLALAGAARMMRSNRPLLLSEFYPLALDSAPWGSAAGYLGMLRSYGYAISVVGGPAGALDDEQLLSLANRTGRDHIDIVCVPTWP